MNRIDLEITLEQHTVNNGSEKVEKTWQTGCMGRGEYVVGKGRLYIMGYKIADGHSLKNSVIPISEVTLGLEKDIQTVIPLDASGIGRMYIPPNQWLIVQDNTVLEK